ncbi:MAG: efflux RND transporter permease subunit [Bdellovibrionota bacterium]
MWIVRLALRRPYTIAVFCLLIAFGGLFSLKGMLVDIFPTIDIPVVGVIWNYPGLSAQDIERRVTTYSERGITTNVNGVSKIESTSVPGTGVIKVHFQPGTNIGTAIAQIGASVQTGLRIMPPGIQPPMVVQSNASSVPVAQITVKSDSVPEERLYDYGLNQIRLKLFTIPGLTSPAPYGGKVRQINVEVKPEMLVAKGLSPYDIVNALQVQNIILPGGSARIGTFEYNMSLNSSPEVIDELTRIPIRTVNSQVVTIGDVATVSDSFADQTNIVRIDGKRSTYLNILKKADASTLDVVNATKAAVPQIQESAPPGVSLKVDFDQSGFVTSAINHVLVEAVIASVLVSLMLLLFLGSWNNVIVVCTSIPLAILAAIIGLRLTGNTINIMTLGGLSLAIGMLVDDATVAVENIHRNRTLGLPLTKAILVGAQQIALPAIMATLSICIVFFPVVLISGPARFLFTPMALSVVLAMMASYVLSRTLVPLLCRMLLAKHDVNHEVEAFPRFNRLFARLEATYSRTLETFLQHRKFVLLSAFAGLLVSLCTLFVIGQDFFPNSDTGLMKLHVRTAGGSRIENTEKTISQIEDRIRGVVPKGEIETINSVIGVPPFFNLAYVPTDNVNAGDAEIFIAMKKGHGPTEEYRQKIREMIANEFPSVVAKFQAADIITQVLNFGLSAPIDVQIEGRDLVKSYEIGQELMRKMRAVPGLADVAMKQVFDAPALRMNVDRIKAAQMGVSQRDVANSMLIALSGSSTVAPSFYLNPSNNVMYPISVKVPIQSLTNVDDLMGVTVAPASATSYQTPVSAASALPSPLQTPQSQTQRMGNLVSLQTLTEMNSISHVNVQRVINITANVEGRDLGTVSRALQKEIDSLKSLPPGFKITVQGQGVVMDESFKSLGLGLIISIALVYLLMVVLFQSWVDPFIVITAVPGALCGILWTMFLTGTTINVYSFMGSIMAVGIAASNAILLVSYANEVRVEKGLNALDAALEAGRTRLRPILMTAIAMILGMLPAALGLGEGGEQNAPLGRAVIGGLTLATFVTLLVVPLVYSLLRTAMPSQHTLDERLKREEEEGDQNSHTSETVPV